MEKILISWIARTNDFAKNRVREDGPTMCFHRFHWDHSFHVLLAAEADKDLQKQLAERIRKEFGHKVEEVTLPVENVLDIKEIKGKTEKVLMQYRHHIVDIFASPGTSAMQVAWYICYTTLGLKGRFLQTRSPKDSKSGKSELFALKFEKSEQPLSMMIFEEEISKPAELKSAESVCLTPALKELRKKALPAAMVDVPVLILGETGTGKELLARYIHDQSYRKNKKMLAFNCSAIGHELLESRLFGYKKGAFTGAEKDTPGLFHEANGSTIFLDEIGDITAYTQKSLLRVLQEKEVLPVGGRKPEQVDVRVIAATNKNLRKLCEEGKFRWDLYYRLAIVELIIPSLAEQGREAIETMLRFMLEQTAKKYKKPVLKVNPDALAGLLSYPWPGNIREMENLVNNFYIYCEKEVRLSNLPRYILDQQTGPSLSMEYVEKQHIIKVLNYTGGSRKKALKLLGYRSYNTLLSKIRKYKIDEIIPASE